jgi:hypothetical protein
LPHSDGAATSFARAASVGVRGCLVKHRESWTRGESASPEFELRSNPTPRKRGEVKKPNTWPVSPTPSRACRRHRRRGPGRRWTGHPADDAGKRGRQRGDDDERVGPGLEVHDDQEIDQHDCAQQAEQQAGEGAVHGLHLAEQYDGGSFRQSLRKAASRSEKKRRPRRRFRSCQSFQARLPARWSGTC